LIFTILMAFVTFVVAPIWLVWAVVDHLRRKPDERRRGGGGISNVVGAALLEADRLLTRPSIEHTIETEKPTLKREDDSGGE
jgi:hypothetical protein